MKTDSSTATLDTVDQEVLDSYTASWYNYLCTAVPLDPESFQLVQGSMKLGLDSTGLYQMCDSIPPVALIHDFSSTTFNRFSSNYGELLNAQLDSTSTALQAALRDEYGDWVSYRKDFYKNNKVTPAPSQLSVFTDWANANLDPGKVNAALAAFSKTLIAPVSTAIKNYLDPTNQFNSEYIYNKSIDDVQNLIKGAPAMTIDFDSSKASADINNTWAKGSVGGGFLFFGAHASSAYDQLNAQMAEAGLTITGSFGSYATVSVGPKGWFDSGVFSTALASQNNNNVWDVTSNVDWDTFFGANGSTQRLITELIIVDNMDITITSKANFGKLDTNAINADATVEYWPFFEASASGGYNSLLTQNGDGNVSVRITSNKGNPMVLGVNVKPVGEIFQ